MRALRHAGLAQLSRLRGKHGIKQALPYPRHGAAGSRTQKFQSSFCLAFLPKSIALLARPGPRSQPCLLPLPSVPRALQTQGHSNGPPQPMPQLSTAQDCST